VDGSNLYHSFDGSPATRSDPSGLDPSTQPNTAKAPLGPDPSTVPSTRPSDPLAGIDPELKGIIQRLGSDDPRVRDAASQELRQNITEPWREQIAKLLTPPDCDPDAGDDLLPEQAARLRPFDRRSEAKQQAAIDADRQTISDAQDAILARMAKVGPEGQESHNLVNALEQIEVLSKDVDADQQSLQQLEQNAQPNKPTSGPVDLAPK
jgi:hypothetical protein